MELSDLTRGGGVHRQHVAERNPKGAQTRQPHGANRKIRVSRIDLQANWCRGTVIVPLGKGLIRLVGEPSHVELHQARLILVQHQLEVFAVNADIVRESIEEVERVLRPGVERIPRERHFQVGASKFDGAGAQLIHSDEAISPPGL